MLITNSRLGARSNFASADQTTGWGDKDCLPPGWLPTDIGAATIRWILVKSQSPSDPFFPIWVAALRGRVPRPLEHETELASLAQCSAHLPEVEPAGIIFHVTRCGSTLLSNAVAAGENVFAVGEGFAFDKMIQLAAHPEPFAASVGARALRDLCKIFAHYRGSPAQQLVLKTGVAQVVGLRAIRSIWPMVPCVMIVRDPVEVVVSNFRHPPSVLLEWYNTPTSCLAGPVPEEALGRGIEVFCAWLVGRMCSVAAEQMDARCLLLDYLDLTPEAALRVAEFFSVRLTCDGREALRRTFLFDAKRGIEFKADTDSKKKAATASMAESVARWALAPYEALLQSEWRYRVGCIPAVS